MFAEDDGMEKHLRGSALGELSGQLFYCEE